MNEPDLLDAIRLYLPKYLAPAQARELWEGLSAFPRNMDYYWFDSGRNNEVLQGDGWRGFVVLDFFSGARKTVSAVVISNSCDISPDNDRAVPANILFAPLIELSKLEERLYAAGRTPEQVASFISDVRQQRITSIFYFPEYSNVINESTVFLDDIHVHPASDFLNRSRSGLFKLNQYAFYLLLMKLSIHFSRFNEGVLRFDAP